MCSSDLSCGSISLAAAAVESGQANVVVAYRPVPDLIAAQRPITLLYGKRDLETSAEAIRRLRAALERADARAEVRIVGGDHHLPIRNPAVVIQTISAAMS